MTTSTSPSRASDRAQRPFGATIRAEWIKFQTLRSNRVLLIIAALFVPLNSLLLSISLRQRASDPDPAMRIPSVSNLAFLDSVLWLQLLIAVVAVLAASSEFHGKLGTSFLAVPTRVPVLASKMLVLAFVAFAIGTVGALIGQLLPYALLPADVAYVAESTDIVRASLASGVYLGLLAAISLGIAVLVGNLVIALLLPLATYTIVPSLIGWLGGDVGARVAGVFPTIAGRTAISPMENSAGLDGGSGLLVMAVWAVAVLVGAAARYRFADA